MTDPPRNDDSIPLPTLPRTSPHHRHRAAEAPRGGGGELKRTYREPEIDGRGEGCQPCSQRERDRGREISKPYLQVHTLPQDGTLRRSSEIIPASLQQHPSTPVRFRFRPTYTAQSSEVNHSTNSKNSISPLPSASSSLKACSSSSSVSSSPSLCKSSRSSFTSM